MYAKGLSTRQISEQKEDIYYFGVSEGMVSDITDKLISEIDKNESSKYWLGLLNEVKIRSINNILILRAEILVKCLL